MGQPVLAMKPMGRRSQKIMNEGIALEGGVTYEVNAPHLRKPNQIKQTITHHTNNDKTLVTIEGHV